MIEAVRGLDAALEVVTIDTATDLPKTNVVGASVRVVGTPVGGPEVEILASTPAAIAPGRAGYIWAVPGNLDPALSAGRVEWLLVDSDGIMSSTSEDLAIRDATASEAELAEALALLRVIYDLDAGGWKVDRITGRMIFYKADNATEIASFELRDRLGNPTTIPGNAYERRRLP